MASEALSSQTVVSQMPAIQAVTAQNFRHMLQIDRPVLFYFWAPWCRPCRELKTVLDQLMREQEASLILAKVNIDMHIEIATQFNVRSVPTLVLTKSGREVTRLLAGSYTFERLRQELQPHLE